MLTSPATHHFPAVLLLFLLQSLLRFYLSCLPASPTNPFPSLSSFCFLPLPLSTSCLAYHHVQLPFCYSLHLLLLSTVPSTLPPFSSLPPAHLSAFSILPSPPQFSLPPYSFPSNPSPLTFPVLPHFVTPLILSLVIISSPYFCPSICPSSHPSSRPCTSSFPSFSPLWPRCVSEMYRQRRL